MKTLLVAAVVLTLTALLAVASVFAAPGPQPNAGQADIRGLSWSSPVASPSPSYQAPHGPFKKLRCKGVVMSDGICAGPPQSSGTGDINGPGCSTTADINDPLSPCGNSCYQWCKQTAHTQSDRDFCDHSCR